MLPDWEPVFELKGEVVTGREGRGAMWRGDCDGDCDFSNPEVACAVGCGDFFDFREFFESLGDEFLSFRSGKNGVSGVVEGGDFFAIVMVPDSTFEDDESS